MKKIMNQPTQIVREMCRGLVLAHPELAFDAHYNVIRRVSKDPAKVTLISGGGSGHEPAHAGLVGEGLLDAAVCGDVFASPSQVQIYQAIRQTAGEKGVLLIIKNYSGDRMNFQNAAAMAAEDGIQVDSVIIDDDIAVKDSLYTVGRRGVAGTILVHKIAGAAAARGFSLTEVKRVAEKAIAAMGSIGFAFSSCTVPAKGSPTFTLDAGEMEYGIGIHGEPGINREPVLTAQELAARMTTALCDDLALTKDSTERLAVLVNGFGATPLMELYVLNHDVLRSLSEQGLHVTRNLVGNYMTSLDMAGASVTFLKLDDELLDLLDQPCHSAGLTLTGPAAAASFAALEGPESLTADAGQDSSGLQADPVIGDHITLNNLVWLVDLMTESILSHEVYFCELDAVAGDGDFGMSLAKGFRELKARRSAILAQPDLDCGAFLDACSLVIMEHCGGASGPIWGAAFRAAGRAVKSKAALTAAEFAAMLQAAVSGIQEIGERAFGRGAVVGDKTLIDALAPSAEAWQACAGKAAGLADCFKSGAAAAVAGAKETEKIAARLGRAGAVGKRSIGHPDAGAHALGVIFTEIAERLEFR